MSDYAVLFHSSALARFRELDNSVREHILKKVRQLKRDLPARHLKLGMPFFVAEVGQYRIVFRKDDGERKKIIYFVGTHSEYEKWYKTFMAVR